MIVKHVLKIKIFYKEYFGSSNFQSNYEKAKKNLISAFEYLHKIENLFTTINHLNWFFIRLRPNSKVLIRVKI